MRISVCIPHRSENLLGLWATVSSCRIALHPLADAEFIVCANGIELTPEHERFNVKYVISEAPVGPARAREICADNATGDVFLFLDDHVIVNPNIFRAKLDKDIVFFPSVCSNKTYYDYEVELSVLTQMDSTIRTTPRHEFMYRCMAAPAGQFMVKRFAWEKMGGYGGVFDGYNGEEVYFGMRAAMFNLECWMAPLNPCHHYVPYQAPSWKNRDEAFLARFEKGLQALKELKAEKTLDEAFEHIALLNQGILLDTRVRDHVGYY